MKKAISLVVLSFFAYLFVVVVGSIEECPGTGCSAVSRYYLGASINISVTVDYTCPSGLDIIDGLWRAWFYVCNNGIYPTYGPLKVNATQVLISSILVFGGPMFNSTDDWDFDGTGVIGNFTLQPNSCSMLNASLDFSCSSSFCSWTEYIMGTILYINKPSNTDLFYFNCTI